MRPAKNILHHVLVRRAITSELRSGNRDDVRSLFEVFQGCKSDLADESIIGARTKQW